MWLENRMGQNTHHQFPPFADRGLGVIRDGGGTSLLIDVVGKRSGHGEILTGWRNTARAIEIGVGCFARATLMPWGRVEMIPFFRWKNASEFTPHRLAGRPAPGAGQV